jgi:2-polyprenyl-3-methyl-5-hydroxy-6-metoxy-1,4-benzoquinol methylase
MKITPAQFLDAEINSLNLTIDNPDFVNLAQAVCNIIDNEPTCEKWNLSWIDYGAGTGVYSEVMRWNGFSVTACDIWKPHRDYMKKQYPKLRVVARPVPTEGMLFIEVAEHMTDRQIRQAIQAINPRVIIFSSTPETNSYDEMWGHINIKQVDEWVDFWASLGYSAKKIDVPTTWSLWLEKI